MIGKWVLDKDMHPTTNIWARTYMDADGLEHVAYQFPLHPAPVAWYFPEERTEHEQGMSESVPEPLLRRIAAFAKRALVARL